MSTFIFISIIYVNGVILTFLLASYYESMKTEKSDLNKELTKLSGNSLNVFYFTRSLLFPITLPMLLYVIFSFITTETKQSFDTQLVKELVELVGKEKTKEILKKHWDILPSYLTKIIN